LARWQADHVQSLLRDIVAAQSSYSQYQFDVVGMSTLGDNDQIKPLRDFNMRGVFTKELDFALLTSQIDLAVHCLKDLPTHLPEGIHLAAILPRGQVEDAIILPKKSKDSKDSESSSSQSAHEILSSLPAGSVIGTSALRRHAFIQHNYPHLVCKDIRGNVNTRLSKLDNGDFNALILARTGLNRLGLDDRISAVIDSHMKAKNPSSLLDMDHASSNNGFGYAVGQGALAIVCREDDLFLCEFLKYFLDCSTTRLHTNAERTLLSHLNGGCKVPIAVYSQGLSISPEQYNEIVTKNPKLSILPSDKYYYYRLIAAVLGMEDNTEVKDRRQALFLYRIDYGHQISCSDFR
jgi:hydroxymethylbilane synthase